MKKLSKVVLSLGVVAALGLSVSAVADVVISSGQQSKSFNKMAAVITQLINRKDITVISSKGSLENIDNLISNKAQVGLAFADSFMYKKASDPRAEKLKIVGTIGKGCLYAVAKEDGKVKKAGDLTSKDIIVDMGKLGSGANSTWMYLGELDKDFKKPQTRNIGDDMGLSSVISGQTDVMLQMQNKSIDNKLVKDVLANKQLKFIPMQAWSFNDKLPNGQAVYTKEKIALNDAFFKTELETICTDTLVLANENVSDDDLDLIAGIVLRNQKAILGEK